MGGVSALIDCSTEHYSLAVKSAWQNSQLGSIGSLTVKSAWQYSQLDNRSSLAAPLVCSQPDIQTSLTVLDSTVSFQKAILACYLF